MGGDPRGPARAAGGRACLFRAEIADGAVRQRHRHRARHRENRHGEPRLELQTPRLAPREKCARLSGKCLPKGLEETNPEIGRPVKPGWPLSHARRHYPKIAGFFEVSSSDTGSGQCLPCGTVRQCCKRRAGRQARYGSCSRQRHADEPGAECPSPHAQQGPSIFRGGWELHLRTFVTTTKAQPSLNHNIKSVPWVLTADTSREER